MELCKWLKFNHTTKWHIYKQDPVQENKTRWIVKHFAKRISVVGSTTEIRPVITNKNKKNWSSSEFLSLKLITKWKWKKLDKF